MTIAVDWDVKNKTKPKKTKKKKTEYTAIVILSKKRKVTYTYIVSKISTPKQTLNATFEMRRDFQQYDMCNQQRLRSAWAYAQSDQSLC